MSEAFALVLALLVGAVLGAIFFGGLWWTIRKGLASKQPALWFLGSLLARMSIALLGFYSIGRDHWQRLLLCLLGFFFARLVVTWLTRPPLEDQAHPVREVGHAT